MKKDSTKKTKKLKKLEKALNKAEKKAEELKKQRKAAKEEIAAIRKKLKKEKKSVKAKIESGSAPAESLPASMPTPVPPKIQKPVPDDLKVIRGIGNKIEQLLNAAGVYTWADLAQADEPVVKEVLASAGPRFKSYDPATWYRQAKLAADGRWEELKSLQARLEKKPEAGKPQRSKNPKKS